MIRQFELHFNIVLVIVVSSFGALEFDVCSLFLFILGFIHEVLWTWDNTFTTMLIEVVHYYEIEIFVITFGIDCDGKQETKINSSCNSWEDILFGVPQRSVPDTSFFYIFLGGMFFLVKETEFPSYADDNTLCVMSDNVSDVIKILENDSIQLFKWFSDNQINISTTSL